MSICVYLKIASTCEVALLSIPLTLFQKSSELPVIGYSLTNQKSLKLKYITHSKMLLLLKSREEHGIY